MSCCSSSQCVSLADYLNGVCVVWDRAGVVFSSDWVVVISYYALLFSASFAGGSIIILKAFDVKELTGDASLTRATILLFFFFGTSTAGLTYCLSYLFKSASTAQNMVIFLNVSRTALSAFVYCLWLSFPLSECFWDVSYSCLAC